MHGFLLSGSTFASIDFPGAASSEALGINNRGDVVGDYSLVGATPCCGVGTHGFVLSEGTFSIIDVPGSVFTYMTG